MRAPVRATTPDGAGACAIEGCISIATSTARAANATRAKTVFEMRVMSDLRLSSIYYRRFSQNRTTESASHAQAQSERGPTSIAERHLRNYFGLGSTWWEAARWDRPDRPRVAACPSADKPYAYLRP